MVTRASSGASACSLSCTRGDAGRELRGSPLRQGRVKLESEDQWLFSTGKKRRYSGRAVRSGERLLKTSGTQVRGAGFPTRDQIASSRLSSGIESARQSCLRRRKLALRLRGVPAHALPCRPKRRLSQAVADAYVLAAGSRHPSEPCPVSFPHQTCAQVASYYPSPSNPLINKQVVAFADRRRDVFPLRNPSHHRVFRTRAKHPA
jgi:hypothetical protein